MLQFLFLEQIIIPVSDTIFNVYDTTYWNYAVQCCIGLRLHELDIRSHAVFYQKFETHYRLPSDIN